MLSRFIPPVATRRVSGNGPRIAANQPTPSSDAGKALSHDKPNPCACWISDAVATPGRCGIPAARDARATGPEKPGATVNAAPAAAATSTRCTDVTVPAPTIAPRPAPLRTACRNASSDSSDCTGTSTRVIPRSHARSHN